MLALWHLLLRSGPPRNQSDNFTKCSDSTAPIKTLQKMVMRDTKGIKDFFQPWINVKCQYPN